MLTDLTSVTDPEYRLINYRTVSSLCAAEYIHDLYNRHLPEVNSIRFRETVTTYRNGSLFSFAPISDWQKLSRWFGRRLRNMDGAEVAAIRRYIARPHEPTANLENRLRALKLQELSGWDLAEALIDLHYVTLGDIYGINLVQIEHALGEMVRTELVTHFGEAHANAIMAQELGALDTTVAREEHREFQRIVADGLARGSDPRGSDDGQIQQALAEHLANWGGVFRGYGADAPSISHMLDRYARAVSEGPVRSAPDNHARADLPTDVGRRIALMRDIGQLRDSNKALLGRVMQWRERIVAEIGRRYSAQMPALSLYALGELCELAADGRTVAQDWIDRRREGVVLRRVEGIYSGVDRIPALKQTESRDLVGTCASRGQHVGKVRLVRSATDAHQVEPGEVLVAPGTDFDLLVGMQRAGAIVTEEGGMLSHAAVVAREYGIPCVVAVAAATTILQTGELVHVDGDAGLVKRRVAA